MPTRAAKGSENYQTLFVKKSTLIEGAPHRVRERLGKEAPTECSTPCMRSGQRLSCALSSETLRMERFVSTRFNTRSLGAAGLLLGLLGAGCGGGGADSAAGSGTDTTTTVTRSVAYAVAPVHSDGSHIVNPAASWKSAARDQNAGSVFYLNLSPFVSAGTTPSGITLNLKVQGRYFFQLTTATSAPATNNLSAIFADDTNKPIKLAAGSALPGAPNANCATEPSSPDANAPDFMVPTTSVGTNVIVPAGATRLLLSVDDCIFSDNFNDLLDPLRIKVSRVTP
jgi:hypothetical protein